MLKKALITLTAGLLSASALTGFATATPARASSCVEGLSPLAVPYYQFTDPIFFIEDPFQPATIHEGDIYLVYNSCAHTVQLEWNRGTANDITLDDYAGLTAGTYIPAAYPIRGCIAVWHAGRPLGTSCFDHDTSAWIDSVPVSIYSSPTGDRTYAGSVTWYDQSIQFDGSAMNYNGCTVNMPAWNFGNGSYSGSVTDNPGDQCGVTQYH